MSYGMVITVLTVALLVQCCVRRL